MGSQLQDRLVEMHLNDRLEAMYNNLLIVVDGPELEGLLFAEPKQLVAFDAATALVVAHQDHLASQVAVTEPELILGQEPAWVVCRI